MVMTNTSPVELVEEYSAAMAYNDEKSKAQQGRSLYIISSWRRKGNCMWIAWTAHK